LTKSRVENLKEEAEEDKLLRELWDLSQQSSLWANRK
jgi:hypothetical protein